MRELVQRLAGDSRVIRRNTPLFESGLIDSMSVLDLIVRIEQAIGRRIADEEIALASFRTIGAISATFWTGEDAPATQRRVGVPRR